MVKRISSPKIFGLATILVMLFSWECASRQGPKAQGPSGVRPSELLAQKPPQPAPKLAGFEPGPAVPAPGLGEHTEEVLGTLGIGKDELASLRAGGVI